MSDARIKSRIVRIFRIETMLLKKPGGMRVREIARETGMDRRTIYRDLDLLGEIGVPVWQNEGRWGIDGRWRIPDYRDEVWKQLEV